MAKVKKNLEDSPGIRPALSPEARENQLISLAVDQAEQQLMAGKASNQVLIHYLKLGTTKQRLELEKIKNENLLLAAKTEAIQSGQHMEELYHEAMSAFKKYSGHSDE